MKYIPPLATPVTVEPAILAVERQRWIFIFMENTKRLVLVTADLLRVWQVFAEKGLKIALEMIQYRCLFVHPGPLKSVVQQVIYTIQLS